MAGEAAGGEEEADDWADGGDSEADCRCKTLSRRRDQPRIESYYLTENKRLSVLHRCVRFG